MSESAALAALLTLTRNINYNIVASTTLFLYDWSLLFYAEVAENIYWKPRSLATTLYLAMKIMGVLYFLGTLFYVQLSPHVTLLGCKSFLNITEIVLNIGYTATMKMLLVLRLRALYRRELKVTIILYSAMIVEILIGLVNFGFQQYLYHKAQVIQNYLGLPGCWIDIPEDPLMTRLLKTSGLAIWFIRMGTTGVELLLMLFQLYKVFRQEVQSLQSAVSQAQALTPVLYVFYRDGMLMFIPVFIIDCFGIIRVMKPGSAFSHGNWAIWLAVAYHVLGTRLILNLRRANCKLTETTIPHQISTLKFNQGRSRQDTEVGDEITG